MIGELLIWINTASRPQSRAGRTSPHGEPALVRDCSHPGGPDQIYLNRQLYYTEYESPDPPDTVL